MIHRCPDCDNAAYTQTEFSMTGAEVVGYCYETGLHKTASAVRFVVSGGRAPLTSFRR